MKIKQAIFMVTRDSILRGEKCQFLGIVAFDAEQSTAEDAAMEAWGTDSQYKPLSSHEAWGLKENLPVLAFPGE